MEAAGMAMDSGAVSVETVLAVADWAGVGVAAAVMGGES